MIQLLTAGCWLFCRVDPFDENSPLKKMAIEKFPGAFRGSGELLYAWYTTLHVA